MTIPINTMTGAEASGIASQVGLQASQTALNFQKINQSEAQTQLLREQAKNTSADTNNKVADFQAKMQDIMTRDMEIDVLQQEQQGKLANAKMYSERNVSIMSEMDNMKQSDALKVQAETVQNMSNLQDAELLSMVPLASGVNDPKSHFRAYDKTAEFLKPSGKTPEDIGITREYQGQATIRQWERTKNSALSTRELLSTERLNNEEYKRVLERDAKSNEYQLDRDATQFLYQNYLQDQRLKAQLDVAKIRAKAASATDPLKRTDADTLSTPEIVKETAPRIADAIGLISGDFVDMTSEDSDALPIKAKIVSEASKIATMSQAEADDQWKAYLSNPSAENIPESIHTIIDRNMSGLVRRTGTDGTIYESEENSELKADKQRWIQSARESDVAKELYNKYPPATVEGWLEQAWGEVSARQEMK